MKTFSRLLALMLALSLLGGCALAESPELQVSEEAQVESQSVAEAAAQEDAVLAVVNGENLMQSDVDSYAYYLLYLYYSQGFDITDPELTAYIQQAALQGSVEQAVFFQKAKELGFDQFTAEEQAQLEQEAQASLDAEIKSWITANAGLAEDATDEDKATARVNAIAALESEGYTLDALIASNQENLIYERLYADMVKDATVTDEEIRAAFDTQVASDQQTFADASVYEQAVYYFGMTPYYVPAGYRGITQILLPVDSDLLSNYQGLQASLEEAQDEAEKANEEETTADAAAQTTADASAEPTAAPVTQADVDAAYAAILASVQPTVDEIKAKLATGTPFADLIAEYNTDPGMEQEPYKSEGYSVHMDSIYFDPAFVRAAFSVDEIGEVSEPFVGTHGVYIVCYVRDVPAGPVEYTDEIKNNLSQSLITEKENTLFSEKLDAWVAAAQVTYTDAGNAYLQADQAQATEAPTEAPAAE